MPVNVRQVTKMVQIPDKIWQLDAQSFHDVAFGMSSSGGTGSSDNYTMSKRYWEFLHILNTEWENRINRDYWTVQTHVIYTTI